MRKVLLALAAAGSALAIATPAAAQYYPQYGYNDYGYNGYGYNGYGYNNRGQLQNELQRLRFQADRLARQGRLTRGEARDLYGDIASAERSLYRAGNPWEARERIEHVRRDLRRYADYDGRYGWNGYNGYGHYDRDRDDRDDRDND